MRLDNNQQVFFALLKAGLWESFPFHGEGLMVNGSSNVDWEEVYRLATEQSVMGLVLAGIEKTNTNCTDNTNRLPQELLLQWIGEVQIIEEQNKAMNKFVAKLIEKLRKEKVYAILVKGQGIAQCYDRPLWRASGDVDLLLSDSNYENAKKVLIPLALNVDNEIISRKHLSMTIYEWTVELHGSMFGGWSKCVDRLIEEVQDDCFKSGSVRSWENGKTHIFLPSPDNDVIIVFTHILQHFFVEGIGLRQICDWCRLLYTYKGQINISLLERRLKKSRLMSKWIVFASLAVEFLGMPNDAMPLYDSSTRFSKKAKKVMRLILDTGNFGQSRDASYKEKYPIVIRYGISFYRHTSDMFRKAAVFPMDSVSTWCRVMRKSLV